MKNNYDIFISYRRDGGEIMAKLLYIMLTDRGYSVFYDRVSIKTGRFDETIEASISNCTDFILVLSPKMFDNRDPKNDEVLKELLIAKRKGKNILPLQMDGFVFPKKGDYDFPEELDDFYLINAPQIKIDSFDFKFLSSYLHANRSEKVSVLSNNLAAANKVEDVYRDINSEIKIDTVRNIFNSYMEKENTDMILNMILPYVNRNFNEKKDFKYSLELRQHLAQLAQMPFSNMENKYYRLGERLSFTKKYIKSEGLDSIWVAFDFEDEGLDETLRRENVFFSESLKLRKEDIEILKGASEEQLQEWYSKIFLVQVAINGKKMEPAMLEVDTNGLFAKYDLGEMMKEIKFKISFEIPFDAENNHVYVAISEPTYSPEILIRYDNIFKTEMIPFFDDTMTLSDSTDFDGEYEFTAPGRWVMPMSGAVINIRTKK